MINENPHRFTVLIAASGSGSRLGDGPPKQYRRMHGKAVLRHTIEKFIKCPGIAAIHVIINPDHAELYQEAVKDLNLPRWIAGGKTRKESIYNGLKKLSHLKDNDIILLHDAARPCVSQKDILDLVNTLENGHRAATLSTPVSDTLRRCENQTAQTPVDRDNLYALQTPQGFHYGLIKSAHENADPLESYTDDTRIATQQGHEVRLVPGSKTNIKLTTQEDWILMEKLLAPHTRTVTGMGFDVHAFEDNPEKPLILCGIKINHHQTLKGHSDADVGLHAITDALLGCIGAGDIGDHFPPSDPAFKDMNSAIFLEKARDLIHAQGGIINNIDLTLICEEPKMGPHKRAMQTRIAEILTMDPAHINIKATTTEKLGFTGRGEGIAAQAVASVSLP